ncbi:MAG: glyoxylate/hydroxypyruvate reductase A [Dongiaceae bacterium]
MTLLINVPDDPTGEFAAWIPVLQRLDPARPVRLWPDTGPEDKVEYALTWRPKPGDLQRYKNLKAIFNLGAGVDALLKDTTLPSNVPLVRLVDEGLTQGMSEYVLMHVLRYHRRAPEFEESQRRSRWEPLLYPLARDRKVGILGLGVLGSDAARKLVALDFDVAGWSRTPKTVDGVKSFHGAEGLNPFLNRSEILVCLLPLTKETTGIVNAKTLAQLPKGAAIINAGRGGHVVQDELLAALDSGHIGYATLDVFTPEPLPNEHPFWTHPRVTLTPHVASLTQPETAAPVVLDGIRRMERGELPANIVDRRLGY